MAFWFWGDILVFCLPAWLRMPVGYLVGFCYSTILSSLRGTADGDSTAVLEKIPGATTLSMAGQMVQRKLVDAG